MIDSGYMREKPKPRPLQLKRGTSKAFARINPILKSGEPAWESDRQRLKIGDGCTPYNRLPYIADANRTPKDGKSAYELWKECGHTGTVEDFLESLIGEQGKSTYEIWLSLGNEGTVVDFINSIQGAKGEKGLSAYELWIQEGHQGTLTDFLNSLIGKSAYDIWIDLGHEGSEADFIEFLKGKDGKSAYEIWLDQGNEGTEEDFMDFLRTTTWENF